ncbi:hypothetical protein HDV02_004695, partial [Globomyces sp. JEL0801]
LNEGSFNRLEVQYMISVDGREIIHPLISVLSIFKKDGIYQSPPILSEFFRFFYKSICPAIALAPKALWRTLQDIIDTVLIDENHVKLSNNLSPLLSKFLWYFMINAEYLDHAIKFIKHILKVARDSFTKPSNTLYTNNVHEIVSSNLDPFEELFATGTFFPGRKAIRKVTNIELSKTCEGSCNKNAKFPGRLGSGVLLYWCGEHRFCIGFNILESAESLQE